jgi:hypothetical protein
VLADVAAAAKAGPGRPAARPARSGCERPRRMLLIKTAVLVD